MPDDSRRPLVDTAPGDVRPTKTAIASASEPIDRSPRTSTLGAAETKANRDSSWPSRGLKLENAQTARSVRTRWMRKLTWYILQFVGIALFLHSVAARSVALTHSPAFYDEGIILSNAHFLMRGLAPYRDFYANYPPGVFLLVAGLWKLFGVSAWTYRLLAVVIHATLAVAAGRLAGRIGGRQFSYFAMGLVGVWTLQLGLAPYAWLLGLVVALVFIELLCWARAREVPRRFVIAGIAFGTIGCFRHDLFVYILGLMAVAYVSPKPIRRFLGLYHPSFRHVTWLLIGVTVPMVVVWGPTLLTAGIPRVVRDLVVEQGQYVMPARFLPMPKLLALDPASGWPVFLVRDLECAIVLTLLGPAIAALLLLGRGVLGVRDAAAVMLLGALSVAVLPQVLGRTDITHAVYTISPVLILASTLIEWLATRARTWPASLVLAVGIGALIVYPIEQTFLPLRPATLDGMREAPELRSSDRGGFHESNPTIAANRRAVLAFIAQVTRTSDRVFFGTHTHEWVHVNEVDLYFLADRLPGVRYPHFDPNVVSRDDIQKEMVESLDKHQVRVVVLSSLIQGHESPPGLLPGSTRLDQYIRANFYTAATHGVYTVLVRKT